MKANGFVGLAALLLAALPGRASVPITIYALVDKAEIEPSEGQPERLRLTGTFSLALDPKNEEVTPPARGFLYFTLPSTKREFYLKEWNDLKKVAGTGQVVGFGGGGPLRGKVRTDKDITKNPVPYPPSDFGMVKLRSTNPHAKRLLEFKAKP